MRFAVTIGMTLALVGCGSGPRLVPVSGRVLVDGRPVADLRVTFGPIGSPDRPYPGPGSVGRTDEQGRYSLICVKDRQKGAVVGPARVRIQVRETATIDKLPASGKRLPPRFNEATTLTFDVPSNGTEQADFSISWR